MPVEKRQKNSQAQVHHAGGDQDAAGEKMRTRFPSGPARHNDRRHGRRIGSAQQRCQHYPALPPCHLLQNITAIGDRADCDHDQPGLERIDVESAEFLIRQYGQNDSGQKQKLGEGKNLLRSDANGELLKSGLQIEQQQAGDAQRGGNPEVSVTNERAHQKCRETGHLRGDSGGFGGGELVPVRQKQECGDYQKADHQRQQLGTRKQSDGIADQANQRKGAHPSEGVRACRLVLFPFQSYQERQEQDQNDLYSFRG